MLTALGVPYAANCGGSQMTCGIYVINRVDSYECYVGQSINIEERWRNHLGTLRRGNHRARRLQNVFNKYGEDVLSLSIAETGLDPADRVALTVAEQKWMDFLRPNYNTAPAAGSVAGLKHTEESKEIFRAARLKFFQEHPEAREQMSRSQKKRFEDPEQRAKSGQHSRGKPSPFRGKSHSPEALEKMSMSKSGQPSPMAGKRHSEESKQKISASRKGSVPWQKGKPSKMKGVPRTEAAKAAISAGHKRAFAEGRGKTWLASISPEERSNFGKMAAAARWGAKQKET